MVARLFVAVRPPEPVLDAVAALSRPEAAGLRWTLRHQWHVTLLFLGAVEDPDGVADALRGGGLAGAVEAVLGPAVGRFGNRVLHVPVAGLDGLAGRVRQLIGGLGRPPEKCAFTGHLTLARVAGGTGVDLRRLAGEPVTGRWIVGDVCLVESRLASTGARYEVVERFALASPPSASPSPA